MHTSYTPGVSTSLQETFQRFRPHNNHRSPNTFLCRALHSRTLCVGDLSRPPAGEHTRRGRSQVYDDSEGHSRVDKGLTVSTEDPVRESSSLKLYGGNPKPVSSPTRPSPPFPTTTQPWAEVVGSPRPVSNLTRGGKLKLTHTDPPLIPVTCPTPSHLFSPRPHHGSWTFCH